MVVETSRRAQPNSKKPKQARRVRRWKITPGQTRGRIGNYAIAVVASVVAEGSEFLAVSLLRSLLPLLQLLPLLLCDFFFHLVRFNGFPLERKWGGECQWRMISLGFWGAENGPAIERLPWLDENAVEGTEKKRGRVEPFLLLAPHCGTDGRKLWARFGLDRVIGFRVG